MVGWPGFGCVSRPCGPGCRFVECDPAALPRIRGGRLPIARCFSKGRVLLQDLGSGPTRSRSMGRRPGMSDVQAHRAERPGLTGAAGSGLFHGGSATGYALNFGASDRAVPLPASSCPRSLCAGTRREFLWQAGAGFAGLALTALLDQDGFFQGPAAAAVPAVSLGTVRPPHQPLRAKACIFLFMYGGPSQMDLFDYKPELQKRDGQSVDMEIRRRSVQSSKLLASRRTWAQHGQSGQWCSDAFPLLSRKMDKLAVIKSLYADSFAHGSAMLRRACSLYKP